MTLLYKYYKLSINVSLCNRMVVRFMIYFVCVQEVYLQAKHQFFVN